MDDVAGIVQSIQIATTLNKRVGQLVGKRTYDNADALSFDLGELRQLYPEVWAHLDDARAELARRGIDVPRYDELRSSYEANAGGVLDVQLAPTSRVEKAAATNVEGHQKALEACYVLRAAVPGMSSFDWDNLARKDEELATSVSLGPARWKRMLVGALAALALIAAIAIALLLLADASSTPQPKHH
jgi:hypothetical protein